jgi:parallel beta helix pectate lyase-like protein
MAGTYYVKSTGSDGANGTSPGTAWKTLTPVNGHTFVPGDTILFNGGDTFTGGLFVQNVASDSANPITFDSYGTGRATISSAAGTIGCYIYKMGGVVIQNLNFTGPGVATANKDGIQFYNDAVSTLYPYIRIIGCNATGYVNGISIGGGNGSSGYSDVRIENCDCYTNSKNGIITFATNNNSNSNIYIGHCKAYNNTGIAGQTSPTGSGIQIGEVDTCTVEYCLAYGNGATNTFSQGPVGMWCYDSNAVTFQYCESYDNFAGSGGDGDGIDIDGGCTNCIIQYCYSHGNEGSGFCLFQYAAAATFSNNIIRYCISESDQWAGIALWGANNTSKVTNSKIYNNTVYASLGPALDIFNANLTAITVTNNIFLTVNSEPLVNYPDTAGFTFTKNNYFNLSGSFVIWWGGTQYSSRTAWGQDATGFSVNPQLDNPGNGGTIGNADQLPTLTAYQIASTSPMRNVGATVSSPGSVDFYGDPLFVGVPDVGADEYWDKAGRNKRAATVGIDGIYRMVLPLPDASVDDADRWQISGKYQMTAAPPVSLIFRNRTAARMRPYALPC